MKKTSLNLTQLVIMLGLFSVLGACGESGVSVTAKFGNTKDISDGATVYFEGRSVGEVADVSGTDTGSVVKIEINKDAAANISSGAAVVVNRVKPGAPIEIHNPAGELVESLQAGQTILGIDSMLELMAWSVGDALNEGGKELTSFVKGFTNYVQGDDFQNGKDQFRSQMNEAAGAATKAIKSIEQDIGEAFDDMLASEKEMANAIEELGNELSPMVQEMSKTGTELALEMERFAQSLERATPEQQESGQRLMESMTEMLNKLNESMEKGANEATP